jgi:hypothetical protein
MTLRPDELRSKDAWGWTYHCLQGHVRQHLAVIAPVCARAAWPVAVATNLETAGAKSAGSETGGSMAAGEAIE